MIDSGEWRISIVAIVFGLIEDAGCRWSFDQSMVFVVVDVDIDE